MKRLFPLALVLGLALTAAGCGDDEKAPCDAACDAAAKANCVNDDSKAVCVAECKEFYNDPVCQAEARALVKCWSKNPWTCDEDGFSGPTGCEDEVFAYVACLD